ncbi:MAG: putative bifunctional diguanylate cyclase/phosphodiesterase, partial [Solirubrobacteraceae bacterium]
MTHALAQWSRRNALLVFLIAGVVCALLASVAVVRSSAGEKDRLRQAQIAVAQVPGALAGVNGSPQSLLAGQPAVPSEFPLNAGLRDSLAAATVTVVRFWPTTLGRELRDEATRVNAVTAQMMGLLSQHHLVPAIALYRHQITPASDSLSADVSRAESALAHEIASTDQTSWILTLVVVGVAGLLLLIVISGVGLARTRGERTRSERERAEIAALVASESLQRLEALVEHGSDMITVLGSDATVMYQAGAVEAMLGRPPEAITGTKLTEWVDPGDTLALLTMCATRRSGRQELRMLHSDGRTRICEASATPLVSHPVWGDVVVMNSWDVTDRKVLEERLRHQAFHDDLTGLPNRAVAIDRAQQMLARARRDHSTVIALFIDLDGFKHVNDSFGHAAGDELLRTVGARLSRTVRESDVVARLGGDEFVVIVDGATLDIAPELVAERLMAVLAEPIELADACGHPLRITASVGIATGQLGTADELLRDADLALYGAKDAGKNRYEVFESSMQSTASERIHLALELREAIESDQLFLQYQPTFDLRTETVTGVEALVRWR